MAQEDPDSSDEFVSEKMWVKRRKGSRLSNSHKNPGEFSPLTRDHSAALGHVTLSPIDENDADQSFVYPPSDDDYDNGSSPRRTQAQEDWDEFVRTVIRELLAIAIERSTPHAKRFWTEKVRPAIRARIDWIAQQRELRRQRRIDKKAPVEVLLVEPTQQVAAAVEKYRVNMDSSEAQARLLAAFAARAFYEEQVRLVAAADIQVDEALLALQRVLSELPPEQVKKMLETFGANPSLLSGNALTDLGLVLGVERADAELIPLDERNGSIP